MNRFLSSTTLYLGAVIAAGAGLLRVGIVRVVVRLLQVVRRVLLRALGLFRVLRLRLGLRLRCVRLRCVLLRCVLLQRRLIRASTSP